MSAQQRLCDGAATGRARCELRVFGHRSRHAPAARSAIVETVARAIAGQGTVGRLCGKMDSYSTAFRHLAARTGTADFQVCVSDGVKSFATAHRTDSQNRGRPAPLPCAVHGLNFCASVLMMAPFSALTPDGLRKAAVAARHSRSQLQSHPSIARRTIGAASARWNERVTTVIRCQGRSSRNSERARLCDASSSTAHGAGPVRRQVQREQWSL